MTEGVGVAEESEYVVNDDTYRLKFADGIMSGAVIEVADLDVRTMIRIQAMERGSGDREEFFTMAWGHFLRSLVSWNLTYWDRSGEEPVKRPVPRTLDGLDVISLRKFMPIFSAWMNALTSPSEEPDLGKDLPSGGPSLADIETKEPGSPNRPN